MTLQVLISTYGADGLRRVARMALPRMRGVSYLVCVQHPDTHFIAYDEALQRSDMVILEHDTRGLSINRNFSLDNATGDILLIADDDLNYTSRGLQAVIDAFENNPSLDFATFRHTGGDNKQYPDSSFEISAITLSKIRKYYLTSFELAIRRAALPPDVRFPAAVGVGSPYFGAGEENIFLLRMLRHGLKGRFFPVTVVEHPGVTTGVRPAGAAALRGQGNWMRLRFGFMMGLLRLLRDVPRRNAPVHRALYYMLAGFFATPRYFTRDGDDKDSSK